MLKLILVLLNSFSYAQTKYDFEYNLTTLHFFETCGLAQKFANKSYACGKGVNNPIFAIKDKSTGNRFFAGANSVGSAMAGFSYTDEEFGFVFGAYLQDVSEFEKRDILPVTFARLGTVGLTPITGYELDFKTNSYKVFSIITPILLTVGVGFSF